MRLLLTSRPTRRPRPVRNALIGLALLLVLGGGFGAVVWQDRTAVAKAAALQASLDQTAQANKSLADSLSHVQEQAAQFQRQSLDLAAKLQAISSKQQTAKATLAKVVKDASPSDQDLLNRQLPDGVLRLLPSGSGAGS